MQYNFNIDFVINFAIGIGFILSIVYLFKESHPLYTGIYRFYSIDYVQFIIKFIFKTLFYRVLLCDNIIDWILYLQKYMPLVKTELEAYKISSVQSVSVDPIEKRSELGDFSA